MNVLAFPEPQPQTRFEEIWKLWPNKAKKPLAKARYLAAVAGMKTRTLDKDSGTYVEIEIQGSEDEIYAGVRAYLDSQIDRNTFKLKDGGKYIPHLATWINQGRWMDFQ